MINAISPANMSFLKPNHPADNPADIKAVIKPKIYIFENAPALFSGAAAKPVRDKLNYIAVEKDFYLNSAVIKTQIQDMFFNFLLLGRKLNLDYTDIQKLYVLKATLNIVRNKNGYKEGTYNKTWSFSTKKLEDNYVVFGAKDEFQEIFEKSSNPFEDAEDFVQGLYDKYGKIKRVD